MDYFDYIDYSLIASVVIGFVVIWFKLCFVEKNILDQIRQGNQVQTSKLYVLERLIARLSDKNDGLNSKLDNQKVTLGKLGKQLDVAQASTVQSINNALSDILAASSQNQQSIVGNFNALKSSISGLNQLSRDCLDKANQIGYGVDTISSAQVNNHNVLLKRFEKLSMYDEFEFQKVRETIAMLQSELKMHGAHLQPLYDTLSNLEQLNISIKSTILKIQEEEETVASMANKHESLIETVRNLNKTSVEIFELLKIFILNYSLSSFEDISNKYAK